MSILNELNSLQAVYEALLGQDHRMDIKLEEALLLREIKGEIDQVRGLAEALAKGEITSTYDGKSDIAVALKKLQGKMFSILLQNQKYFPNNSGTERDFFTEFGGSFREMAEKITLLNSIIESTPKTNNPVTGLNNQESFEQKAAVLFGLTKEHNIDFIIFRIDIDRYSEIIKSKSKETINLLNRHFALAVNSLIREGDLFGHYKEGSFNLAISGISIENARLLAWRISDRLEKNVFRDMNGGNGFFVRINMGATMRTKGDEKLKMMVERASDAARNARKNGGGYIFFEDIN